MMQMKLVNKAKTIINIEDDDNKASLGCRKSSNSKMGVNYSHNCMKMSLLA